MADEPSGGRWRERALLLARFLRHPRTVGAVAPSSPTLARAMVSCLDSSRPERVVELGPGTGAFTGAIRARLGPGARFLAVDVDPAFVATIRRRWPEIDCVCASAEQLEALVADRALGPIDHIVSGLPFVSLPAPITGAILDAIAAVLRPGGTFTTFQYLHGFGLPPAIAFRHRLTGLLGGPPESRFVFWNTPPAFVLTWRKV